ncbi:MAG: hypothetical protein ACREKI_02140 [Gemmatimonadota bacterium]
MIGRLVLRHLAQRPVRSLVFVGAYAAGVGVMLSLLAIGEVMVAQARDEAWIGGGDLTVLPAGVDLETLKLGGAVFFGIEQARFLAREVLGGPRLAGDVAAVAPWLDDRALYLHPQSGGPPTVLRVQGLIPSAARSLGAAPDLLDGTFEDHAADCRWLRPTPLELYTEIDGFHLPPTSVRGDTTWAEWHYFNLLWPDEGRWLTLSFILAGDVTGSRFGGLVLARYRTPDGRDRVYSDTVSADAIEFAPGSADVRFGRHSVRLGGEPAGYRVQANLPGDGGGLSVAIDIEPLPHRYFPAADIADSDSIVSGYVVPALRARARGRVCLDGACRDAAGAVGYHDHNWGTWGDATAGGRVTWDWGAVHAGDFDLLYGGLGGAAAEARRAGFRFLAYVVDSLGVAAILEPQALRYSGDRHIAVAGRSIVIPERLDFTAARGLDTLRAEARLSHVSASPAGARTYFLQAQGTMRLTGTLGGRALDEQGPGFFETYVQPTGHPALTPRHDSSGAMR